MVYPFKKMIGNQPAGVENNTILVPHRVGAAGGPDFCRKTFDWNLALEQGAAAAVQTYTGAFQFVDTESYRSVNYEVGPCQKR